MRGVQIYSIALAKVVLALFVLPGLATAQPTFGSCGGPATGLFTH